MSKERLVCVEWEDASFNSGYYDEKTPENFEPVTTRTVGFVVKSTSKAIFLSFERSYNTGGKPPDNRHIDTIPKKMIKRIIDLEERK